MKRVKEVKGTKGHESHGGHAETRLLWAAVALCFGLGALLGVRQIASPDIGFHLSSARWMLEHRAWPVTDTFSFTFPGHAYIDMQWIFQLLLYGANHLGGTALMIAMKIVMTLAFYSLLVVRARRVTGTLPRVVPLLLMLVALGDYAEERPQSFSWVFGSLVLLILEEFARGNRRWLAALPVILLVWVNTHQLFVLGLVAIAVYVVWELRKGAGADRRLLVCALLSLAVCVINPYHVKGLLLPLTLFGEIQSGQVWEFATSNIGELQSPFSTSLYFVAGRLVLFQPPFFWHVYTLLALVGIVGAWRHVRVQDVVLWALFAFVFSKAHKNFGYFVMVTFPLAAVGVEHAISWARSLARKRAVRTQPAPSGQPRTLIWAQIALCLALVVLVASGRLYKLAWIDTRIRAGYNSAFLPVEASQFLNEHHIEGKVLTSFGFGAYVHWATRLPVSIYSLEEVVSPEFFADYLTSLTPTGFPGFLARYRPTVAVVSFNEAPYWAFYLNAQPTWRLVQFTDSAAVYLHDSVAGPPRLPDPKPNVDYTPHTREEMKRVIAEAAGRREMSSSAWLQGISAFQQPKIRLATFYLHQGQLEASVNTGVDALASSPIRVTEVFLILGNAFNARGDYELSDLCFATVLKSSPGLQTRQQIEQAVRARTKR